MNRCRSLKHFCLQISCKSIVDQCQGPYYLQVMYPRLFQTASVLLKLGHQQVSHSVRPSLAATFHVNPCTAQFTSLRQWHALRCPKIGGANALAQSSLQNGDVNQVHIASVKNIFSLHQTSYDVTSLRHTSENLYAFAGLVYCN